MKKVRTFFGLALTLTLLLEMIISSLVIIVILWRPFVNQYIHALLSGVFISQLVQGAFLCPLVVGLFYVLKGLYIVFLLQTNHSEQQGKQELKRGVAGVFLAFLLYYLVSYVATFYSIQ